MSLGRGRVVRQVPMTFDSEEPGKSDGDGEGGNAYLTPAEKERARFMGDGSTMTETQEPVWKITKTKGPLDETTKITPGMVNVLDRLKSKLKYKFAQNILGRALHIPGTTQNLFYLEITTKLPSDIGEIKEGYVSFRYGPSDFTYSLIYAFDEYYELQDGTDLYQEALQLLKYTGVMTTGLLAAAGAAGVGAWKLSKKRRYWK